MPSNRRDGSKLSFSERDKRLRERRHGGGNGNGAGARRDDGGSTHAQKAYRAALERAFDNGQLAEFAATLQRGNESIDAAFRSAARAPDPAAEAPHAEAQPARRPEGSPGEPGDARNGGEAPAHASAADRLGAADPERAERRQLARQIIAAEAPRDVARAVDRYLARFGELPGDYEVLEKALIHAKPRVVLLALERLEACIARQKPRRSRSLSVQLSILADTHDDDEVRALASRLRAALA